MPYLQDILKRLRSHSVAPPAELFDAITAKIKEQKEEPAPLDKSEKKIAALQGLEVSAPEFLFDNIVKAIKENERIAEPAKAIPIKRNYMMAIAASVVVLVAAFGTYNFINKEKAITETAKVTEIAPANPATGKIDSVPPPAYIPKSGDKQFTAAINKSSHSKKNIAGLKQEENIASVDGYSFPILDNDLMGTFTSFNYNSLPPFLRSENTDAVKVRVDKSTSITLSGDMLSMMKKTYGTKSNGKPTMRAKREKRKLLRWKQADATFFDKNVEKNPMDPIDLAEFIF